MAVKMQVLPDTMVSPETERSYTGMSARSSSPTRAVPGRSNFRAITPRPATTAFMSVTTWRRRTLHCGR